jgi:hypothetical protein
VERQTARLCRIHSSGEKITSKHPNWSGGWCHYRKKTRGVIMEKNEILRAEAVWLEKAVAKAPAAAPHLSQEYLKGFAAAVGWVRFHSGYWPTDEEGEHGQKSQVDPS